MSLKLCRRIYTSFLIVAVILWFVVVSTESSILRTVIFILVMLCFVCMVVVILVFWRCAKCEKMLPLRIYPIKEVKCCPYCKEDLNTGY